MNRADGSGTSGTKKEATLLQPKKRHGLTVIVTGNGKGKTTAALGMVLRSAGYGMRCCVVQFIKGSLHAGEWDGLAKLGESVALHVCGEGYCPPGCSDTVFAKHRLAAQSGLRHARERMASGELDLLVLDEINNAVSAGLIDLDQLHDLIDHKPQLMHLVLTGRDADATLIARADTVSEVLEIKHAYRLNIEPQPGIDY